MSHSFIPTPGWRGRAPTNLQVHPLDLDSDFEEARAAIASVHGHATVPPVSSQEPLAVRAREDGTLWLIGRSGHATLLRPDEKTNIPLTVELAPHLRGVTLRLSAQELLLRRTSPVNLAAWIIGGTHGEDRYRNLRRQLLSGERPLDLQPGR